MRIEEGSWTNGSARRMAASFVDIVIEAQPAAKHLLIEQVSVETYIGNISRQEGSATQLVEDVFDYF